MRKEGAVFAGLEFAHGDCCAVMDCDLQHPPETLVEMYKLAVITDYISLRQTILFTTPT